MKLSLFRSFSTYKQFESFIPKFLGTGSFKNEPAIVLAGCMETARQYIVRTGKKKVIGSGGHCDEVIAFIKTIGKATDYLHLKRLVHMELSLDSVYMQVKAKLSKKQVCKLLSLQELVVYFNTSMLSAWSVSVWRAYLLVHYAVFECGVRSCTYFYHQCAHIFFLSTP